MEWRKIPISNLDYEVSDFGYIRDIITKKYINLFDINGYWYFSICDKEISVFDRVSWSKKNYMSVHRSVALAFIQKPSELNLLQVHHINHIKKDNRVENLMWVTRKENYDDQRLFIQREIDLNTHLMLESKNKRLFFKKYKKFLKEIKIYRPSYFKDNWEDFFPKEVSSVFET